MTTIIKYAKFILFTAVILCRADPLQAQKETEIYIPVGQSPGVSGKYSTMGRIVAVNVQDSTITIARSSGNKTIRITARCEVYLDKSKLKLTNKKGSWADIKTGLMAEAKYKDNNTGSLVEWLKIQLE